MDYKFQKMFVRKNDQKAKRSDLLSASGNQLEIIYLITIFG